MNIIQISVTNMKDADYNDIYGLGDDGIVYYFNREADKWVEMVSSIQIH